jgi:hypothetical protein
MPETSELEFAPSVTPAGALHALAAVRYALHAALRDVCHTFFALFSEAVNADHALFTAAFTLAAVGWLYAADNALARVV